MPGFCLAADRLMVLFGFCCWNASPRHHLLHRRRSRGIFDRDDLMDHECIRARYSSGALYRWEFERHGEAMKIDVPGSLTLDEPEMIAQANRAGIGLAYLGEWMVADDIASGRLVEVLSE